MVAFDRIFEYVYVRNSNRWIDAFLSFLSFDIARVSISNGLFKWMLNAHCFTYPMAIETSGIFFLALIQFAHSWFFRFFDSWRFYIICDPGQSVLKGEQFNLHRKLFPFKVSMSSRESCNAFLLGIQCDSENWPNTSRKRIVTFPK